MPSDTASKRARKGNRAHKQINQNPSLTASTTKLAKKRHSRSRERRSGARENVEGKRWHERKEGNGASRQSQKRQKALEEASRAHEAEIKKIDRDRAAVDKRSHTEDARWRRQKEKLEAALRRARD